MCDIERSEQLRQRASKRERVRGREVTQSQCDRVCVCVFKRERERPDKVSEREREREVKENK